MAKTLVVYKDDEVIREEPKNPNGKTTVTISGLESNTDYTKGTFKISWKDDNSESDLVDVPAFKTDEKGVTSVSVGNDTLTLDVGDTSQIDVTVEPTDADNKAVTYSSNNKAVATVSDSGLIEAVKSGSATITVKSSNNSQATSKVRVTVEDIEDVPPEEPSEEPTE
jgi:hypothetical protein